MKLSQLCEALQSRIEKVLALYQGNKSPGEKESARQVYVQMTGEEPTEKESTTPQTAPQAKVTPKQQPKQQQHAKEFVFDYSKSGTWSQASSAHTLSPEEIGTHKDGWTITGKIHEDYFEWVNYFSASHPEYGEVWGDFEDKVHATSEEAFNHFVENHSPESWDYHDI